MPFISFALSFDSIGCSTFPVHTYILTPHVSLVLTADDIDGITRPEERLVWDETKKQAKGAVADDGAGTIKEDKKPEVGKPSGGIRKEAKNNGKFCTTA